MSVEIYVFIIILLTGMIASYKTGKLTFAGSVTGGVLAILIFAGFSLMGILMLAAFFFFGTYATSWKKQLKASLGIKQDQNDKRDAWQVFANAGLAAILGGLCLIYPTKAELFTVILAGSFASATADTLSSELGNIYGRNYYNILTLRKDKRGLDGVISFEGSFFGIIGAAIIALIYAQNFGWNKNFLIIVTAGFIGNMGDSILGASLERKGFLNNNSVNFLNTIIGALAALALNLL